MLNFSFLSNYSDSIQKLFLLNSLSKRTNHRTSLAVQGLRLQTSEREGAQWVQPLVGGNKDSTCHASNKQIRQAMVLVSREHNHVLIFSNSQVVFPVLKIFEKRKAKFLKIKFAL